jgi:hypothetical protein
VTRILIKDNNDEILVPVGNAPMQQGDTISQIATNGDAVIGSVALTLKDISKGEIIAMQWPFVIGTMLLHLLLWLLYGYLARPTKEQINALSHDIQELYIEQYTQVDQRGYSRDIERSSDDAANNNPPAASESEIDDMVTSARKFNVQNEVNDYLRTQQNSETTDAADSSVNADADSLSSEDNTTETDSAGNGHQSSKLSATRSVDKVRVQIVFHDEFNMLERLAPAQRLPYLALCTQLFNQAVTELLKQPLLLGVSAMNEAQFADNGASVVLKADNSHAKVALAGVMLAKLYLMLNKIIHDKHIELSRFALPAKAGVSDDAQSEAMTHLLQSIGKKEQLLILLPNNGLKQISNHIQVHSIMRPTTVYERECAIFDGGNDSMIQRLADVRNAVLMIEEDE